MVSFGERCGRNTAYSPKAAAVLLGDLLFAHFLKGFAVDAQRGRRACFQALDADFNTASTAITIITAIDHGDRVVDFLDQLTFAITVTQLNGDIGFLAGAIVGVGKKRLLRPAWFAPFAQYPSSGQP